MTIAEKILADHCGVARLEPGEYAWASVDGTALVGSAYYRHAKEADRLGVQKFFDPSRIYAVEDHAAPAPTVAAANSTTLLREAVRKYGITNYFEWGRHGILHELFPNHGYCSPGDLIASVDSHSTSYGCFNVASCPISEELLYILVTGQLWLRVPESIKFELTGALPGPENFVVGKDVLLHIAGTYGTDCAIYKSVEFAGPGVASIGMPGRFSMANMGAELGAKFAIFPCDEQTLQYLEGKMKRPPRPVAADPDARYEAIYQLDMTDLPPYVALPHDPGNSVPITEVASERIKIDQAFLGSCTNGRMEDFRMAARILKGRKVHPEVRFIATPASQDIWKQCLSEGIWEVFSEAGSVITNSTCGACPGIHMGLVGDQEVCISSGPRNFQGRMGSPSALIHLANPATVAASAVLGYIADPRQFL